MTGRRVNALEYVIIPRLEDFSSCVCVCVCGGGCVACASSLSLSCIYLSCVHQHRSGQKQTTKLRSGRTDLVQFKSGLQQQPFRLLQVACWSLA